MATFGIYVTDFEIYYVILYSLLCSNYISPNVAYLADYPCPLVSVRNRAPVYSEIGHTILNMLVDFSTNRYRLPRVDGLVVHVQDKKTTVNLPKQEYSSVSAPTGITFCTNNHYLA